MEISHVISDGILALVGFYVFFAYLLKLDLLSTLLWESFILSIAVAAFFGALKFAHIGSFSADVSLFFQNLATTVGIVGLLAAVYQLVSGQQISSLVGYGVLGLGFIFLVVTELFDVQKVKQLASTLTMVAVAIMGIWAIAKRKTSIGVLLIAAVAFSGLALFAPKQLTNASNAIDAYHYLLAASVLCFGLAASKQQ
jgi:hypothetical protein